VKKKKISQRNLLVSPSQKKILSILADGQFHSGNELAEEIGVSRSTICKYVNGLTEFGLTLSAISGKGYCLDRTIQLLSEEDIKSHLNSETHQLLTELEIFLSINSTNSYLNDKARAEPAYCSGVVCLAEHQLAGRGRRGKDWVSPFGSNIYLSILWTFQQGAGSINGLSLAVGVAVVRALNECGINDIGLKWPNDIYWQGKKLAGILIEVSGESGGPCSAIIGLGLNVYLPKDKAQSITQDWVDLSQIISDNPANIRNKLAAVLLNHLLPLIAHFEQDKLESYLDEWRQYDCMKGRKVDIFMGDNIFSGTVKGVDNNGLLLLSNEQGELKTFASGEVSFRQS
jgi:BirA family biotin operon repressor/biotin-[acetyl-CoA-carboxylase] ligase